MYILTEGAEEAVVRRHGWYRKMLGWVSLFFGGTDFFLYLWSRKPINILSMEFKKEEIAYTNAYGDVIHKYAERFSIRGTIMSARIQKVGDCILHRLYVEDSTGGYSIQVWDNAVGYDREKLRQGLSVRIKGLAEYQVIDGADGKPLRIMTLNGNEIG